MRGKSKVFGYKTVQCVGHRVNKHNLNGRKVLYFNLEHNASVGRVVSQMLKVMNTHQKAKSNYAMYYVSNVQNLTFSKNNHLLMEKYRAKYNAGSASKGPYWSRSITGLFLLVLRGMIKYKGKHSQMYKKMVVSSEPVGLNEFLQQNQLTMDDAHVSNIKVKNNTYSKRTTLMEVMSSLSSPVSK